MLGEKGNYSNYFVLLTFILLLFSACSNNAAAQTTPSSLPTDISLPPTSTATQTQAPSPVPPTVTSIPQPTITPALLTNVEPHPLALDETTVPFDMQLLRRIGTGEPNDVLWSPDGKYLAVATSRGIYLYDGQTYEEVRFIDIGKSVETLAFSPDSRELAVAFRKTVAVWNVASGQQISAMEGGLKGNIGKIVYGSGGHIAAIGDNCSGCGDASPAIIVWDGLSGTQVFFDDKIVGHSAGIDITKDGDTLIYHQGGIRFLDLINRTQVLPIDSPTNSPQVYSFDLLIAPNNEHFFATNVPWWNEPANYLVPLDGGEPIEVLIGEDCWGAKKNNIYAICHSDQNAIIFNLLDGKEITKIAAGESLRAAAINPSGEQFAVINDTQVQIFDVNSKEQITSLEFLVFNTIDAGIISFDGNQQYLAATSGEDGAIKIWNLITGEEENSIKASQNEIMNLSFSPDQHTLAAIDDLAAIRLIDVNSLEVTGVYDLEELSIGPLVFSNDGLQIALVHGKPRAVYTLDLQSKELTEIFARVYPSPYHYSLPFGPFFYSEEDDLISWTWGQKYISLTNLDKNSEFAFPYEVTSDFAIPEAAALSRDGRYAAFGLTGSVILVGELSDLNIIQKLGSHLYQGRDGGGGAIRYLKFSPISSELLLSIGWDDTTRLWNVESGIELKKLDICCYADFTDDGRFLVTAGNSIIEVWGVPPLP